MNLLLIKSLIHNNPNFYKKELYLHKIIQKDRSYLLIIENKKYLYTIAKTTPNKEGFFAITYYKEDKYSPVTLLNENLVDYILIVIANIHNSPENTNCLDISSFFYLFPLKQLPLRKLKPLTKNKSGHLTGLRVYPHYLVYEKPRKDIFQEYFYTIYNKKY